MSSMLIVPDECDNVNIVEYEFVVTDIQFKITDVGGDRRERDKWINFLQVRQTENKITNNNGT